eukprot:3291179-Rhodomonas_salina.1
MSGPPVRRQYGKEQLTFQTIHFEAGPPRLLARTGSSAWSPGSPSCRRTRTSRLVPESQYRASRLVPERQHCASRLVLEISTAGTETVSTAVENAASA